jgi:hypothetical protein
MLCMVTAGISCLGIPYGTVLGIFTFLVLSRPSAIALFDRWPLPRFQRPRRPRARTTRIHRRESTLARALSMLARARPDRPKRSILACRLCSRRSRTGPGLSDQMAGAEGESPEDFAGLYGEEIPASGHDRRESPFSQGRPGRASGWTI